MEKVNLYKGTAKVFDGIPENAPFIRRMNEDLWFEWNQRLLLKMANTYFGRDILCIPQEFPRVDEIGKNFIKNYSLIGYDEETPIHEVIADFRIGAKWANVIRYRWEEFCQMAAGFEESNSLFTPVGVTEFKTMAPCFTTATFYPDSGDPGSVTCDGRVYYATLDTNWATTHDAVNGTGASANEGTVLYAPSLRNNNSGGASYKNFYLVRGGMSFDTSSLTSAATISAATISLYGNAKDNSTYDMSSNIYSFTPAAYTTIAVGDYSQCGTTAFATTVTYASFSTSAYNDYVFNATGISAISKTGISAFSIRDITYDVGNTPNPGNDTRGNYVWSESAENTGTSKDPKLVVTYTTTSISTVMGLSVASVKTVDGLAIASVKTIDGLA